MKEKLLELLWDLENYKYPDYNKKADEILLLFNVNNAMKSVCKHENITRSDRLDECLDCDIRNY